MRARWIILPLAVLALGGCWEVDRPLSYDKGVYGGKKDQKLTEEQLEALRQRATQSQYR